MKISSPGRRELRRQLELSHRRILPGGRRKIVVYKWSDQASRVDLAVRVSAIARAAAVEATYDDGEIIDDDTPWVELSKPTRETVAQRSQRRAVMRRDELLNRTGRKAHAQP